MKRKQTAEQAATKANEYFKGRCTARVTDYGSRLTFESPEFAPIDATEEQFSDVDRFDLLLQNLEDGMRRLAAKSSEG